MMFETILGFVAIFHLYFIMFYVIAYKHEKMFYKHVKSTMPKFRTGFKSVATKICRLIWL